MCGRAWARLERRMRRCYLGRCRGVCRFGARLCQCRGSSSSSSSNSTSRPLYITRVGRLTWGTVHTYSSDGWCSAAAALVRPSAAAPAFLPRVGRGRPCGPPGRKKMKPVRLDCPAMDQAKNSRTQGTWLASRRSSSSNSSNASRATSVRTRRHALPARQALPAQQSRACGRIWAEGLAWQSAPAVERRDSFAQRRKTKGMH